LQKKIFQPPQTTKKEFLGSFEIAPEIIEKKG